MMVLLWYNYIMSRMDTIAIKDIYDCPLALKYVSRRAIEYIQLRDNIAKHGLIDPVTVRPSPTRPGMYELIHGIQRKTACAELNHETIPCYIRDDIDNEGDLLLLILASQAQKVEVKRPQFAMHLRRLIELNPNKTVRYYSGLLNVSPRWLTEQLSLLNLAPDILEMIDSGEISISNAYTLARVPQGFRKDFLHQAKTFSNADFKQLILPQVKAWKEKTALGQVTEKAQNKAVMVIRNRKILQQALDNHDISARIVLEAKPHTHEEAFRLGVAWAASVDPVSLHYQRVRMQAHLDNQKLAGERRKEILQRKAERSLKRNIT
jgi:ParB/RepB/Spo0J family partition protein